jgi:hypothetical protein
MDLIKNNDLINEINKILLKYYKYKYKSRSSLSHFEIYLTNKNLKLQFNFDIFGNILNGYYKGYKIIKVKTTKTIKWNDFIILNMKYYNYGNNPFITNDLIKELHFYNKIDILHINSVIIKRYNKILELNCIYESYTIKKYKIKHISKINKDNHFYFSSFNIDINKEQLHNEMLRLFTNRDSYDNIHIHLDNNHGGQNIPVHLILRCLVGKHEKWMKPIIRINNNKLIKYNCWNEEKHSKKSWEYKQYKKLKIEQPKYNTKYKGFIHLYINTFNGSAAWYFITYMIYAFGKNIKRYKKKCFGQNLKFGKISKNSQLILHGMSNTCSGDHNSVSINYKNIIINCPTAQIFSCSVKNGDYNRFWTQ